MGSHVAAPVLTPNINTTSARDFVPIGPTTHSPAVIVARKDFPAKDLKEFVALLKSGSATLKQGHGGIGSSSHMACLLFNTEISAEAHGGRLSRHRPGDARPRRRPCRFLL
jgi:tripartite-type tricarboxylate transporter receptor subunit TctC